MPDTLTGTFPFLKIRDDTLATRNLTQECKIFFAFSKGKKSSSKISEKNIEMFNLCTWEEAKEKEGFQHIHNAYQCRIEHLMLEYNLRC